MSVVSKKSFDKDGTSVSIDGAPGYFGTDGTRYATCVYVRGRYAFEVLVTGNGRTRRSCAHWHKRRRRPFRTSRLPSRVRGDPGAQTHPSDLSRRRGSFGDAHSRCIRRIARYLRADHRECGIRARGDRQFDLQRNSLDSARTGDPYPRAPHTL